MPGLIQLIHSAFAIVAFLGDPLLPLESRDDQNPPRPLERWLYCPTNLLVDENVEKLATLWKRAAAADYTHILLADSKFCRLGELDARYFRNVERAKTLATDLKLRLVPALFPIGYSNDLLWTDPNLAESLPVRDTPFVVQNGIAQLVSDPAVNLPGGDFNDLKSWTWHDETVTFENGAALIRNPAGQNARVVQKLKVVPFREYHVSVRVKTRDFHGTPEIKALADGRSLIFSNLGVKPTQDWTGHHAVFNSLENTEIAVYFGCWDGQTGSLWWDDAKIEEVGLLNLVRRSGAPLIVRDDAGHELKEGIDYEPVSDPKMGALPWKGCYDIWHKPPVLHTKLPNGTHLRISYQHVVTVYDGQVNICPSEPRTLELLRDQAERMHKLFNAKAYFMSHDEIRCLNWCDACRDRKLDAGAILADNVRACRKILREVAPQSKVYVWSDMFDPFHNAVKDYYLVRGDLNGSWQGLDKDIVIGAWLFDKRSESLKWFADRGHRCLIAGYYDGPPENVTKWLDAAHAAGNVDAVMYTTWQQKYDDLEKFAKLLR